MNKLIQKINKQPTLSEQISKLPKAYFSINDLRKISNLSYDSLKVTLSKLIKTKKIQRIAQGYYTTDLFNINLEAFSLEYYRPSYLSFEWALGYHNILSQQSHAITLATTKRNKEVDVSENSLLIYRHLQKKHFWGFTKEGDILIAEPEKAFLDQAYMSLNGAGVFDPEEMDLSLLNKAKLKRYLKKFDDKRLGFMNLGI